MTEHVEYTPEDLDDMERGFDRVNEAERRIRRRVASLLAEVRDHVDLADGEEGFGTLTLNLGRHVYTLITLTPLAGKRWELRGRKSASGKPVLLACNDWVDTEIALYLDHQLHHIVAKVANMVPAIQPGLRSWMEIGKAEIA